MLLTSTIALIILQMVGKASFTALEKITSQHLVTYTFFISIGASVLLAVCIIATLIYMVNQEKASIWMLYVIEALLLIAITTVATLACVMNILIGTTFMYAITIALLIASISIPIIAINIYSILKFGGIVEQTEIEQDAEAGAAMKAKTPPPCQGTLQETDEESNIYSAKST